MELNTVNKLPMGRFSNLDFDGANQPQRVKSSEPEDVWPNLDEDACMQSGDEKFVSGLYDTALVCYSRALRFNRDLVAAWLGQIRCLICLREYPEAITWSDRALERFGNTPDLLAAKGLALTLLGDHEGLSYLDGAVEMRSPSAWVWLARGEGLLIARQSPENAHRCFLKALEMSPRDWKLEIFIGMAYNRARLPARARISLMSALRQSGENPMALYHLGLASEGLGDSRTAIGFYERALNARAKFPEARQSLERVRCASPILRLWRKWKH